MRIVLVAVGTRMPAWVQAGFEDYARRLPPRECRLELVEIAAAERGKNAVLARARGDEAARIGKALPRDAHVIALDERGTALDSQQWAAQLKGWLASGRDAALVVGGPDGLAPELLARADSRWSLSRLTLPHPLVRIVVAEQLYRAWSLLANHPYHRA